MSEAVCTVTDMSESTIESGYDSLLSDIVDPLDDTYESESREA